MPNITKSFPICAGSYRFSFADNQSVNFSRIAYWAALSYHRTSNSFSGDTTTAFEPIKAVRSKTKFLKRLILRCRHSFVMRSFNNEWGNSCTRGSGVRGGIGCRWNTDFQRRPAKPFIPIGWMSAISLVITITIKPWLLSANLRMLTSIRSKLNCLNKFP